MTPAKMLFLASACWVGTAFLLAGCGKDAGSKSRQTDAVVTPESEHGHVHQGHMHGSQDRSHEHAEKASDVAAAQKTCPVMGDPINPEVFTEHEGTKVYFCCKECIGEFQNDPAKYVAKRESS